MAYQSDTSNRDMNNAVIETILQGELPYDCSISIPELDYDDTVEHLDGLDVEIFEYSSKLRDRVKILYNECDREEVYKLLS